MRKSAHSGILIESQCLIFSAFSSKLSKLHGIITHFWGVQGEASKISGSVESGLHNFEEFVAGQGTPNVIGAPAKRQLIVGMVLGLEFRLEVGEFLEEGIGTDREAQTC